MRKVKINLDLTLGILLSILLAILKATHIISWGLVWILSPIWISFVFFLIFLIIAWYKGWL